MGAAFKIWSLSALFALTSNASPHQLGRLLPRDGTTATVALASPSGTPAHLASGFIYGIPDDRDQIPSSFYEGMGFNYGRAGGAQTPAQGWLGGQDQYTPRFQSALSNYQTCRDYNARFQLLLHDLWGADGTEASDAPFPGDNGDWSSYDAFLDQVISDINSNSMLDGLDIDIWNEPDGYGFWHPSQDQYLVMWSRGYNRLRQAFGTNVPLFGPSMAEQPTSDNTWLQNYLSHIAGDQTIPDQYSWHIEGNPDDESDDPETDIVAFESLLSQYGLPDRQININEYGVPSEQTPAGAAWWISRLEHNNMIGLRGNWGTTGALHDFMASLLGKPGAGTSSYDPEGTGYWANGEYQVYQYYNQNMTGQRVATTPSSDRQFDVYATSTGDSSGGVKILCGARQYSGTWYITVTGLTAVGLPDSGTVNINTYRFDYTGGAFGDVGAPVDLGVAGHDYSDDQVTFFVTPETSQTAYAFEFV